MTVEFVALDTVLLIHEESRSRFGGLAGLRSLELLESAIEQPTAMFGGEFLYNDLFAMAAAYLFYVVSNHAFLDGNKRTGLAVALAFLDENRVILDRPNDRLYEATMAVAEGRLDKSALAELLRELAQA
jgi:death-on-curing protein